MRCIHALLARLARLTVQVRDLYQQWTPLFMVALALAGGLLVHCCASAQVPAAAARFRADLTRTARAVWGLQAPVATFAAQVHQESAWRPGAVSHAGAAGLAQFMPATAAWIGTLDPQLAPRDPFNAGWALRALVTYDAWLAARTRAVDACEQWAFILAAYNGGLGWVQRDRRLAGERGHDVQRWFGHVEHVNAGRSQANWQENRDYPRRILHLHEPRYVAAGWGPGVCP